MGQCERFAKTLRVVIVSRDGVEEVRSDVLWDEAVAFTRGRSPGSFDQWFSGIQFDGLTEGVLGLRARDEFVREWVDHHFMPTITDFIRSKTGWSVQVAWSVGGGVERPVSVEPARDEQAMRPLRPRALSVGGYELP